MVIHFIHLVLAAAMAAALAGMVTLFPPRPGVRIRVGVGGRARTAVLPRRRLPFLPVWLQGLAHLALGDVRGPVGPGLYLTRIERAGLPGLRWRLLHAGLGHRSVAWLRRQQAAAVAAIVASATAILLALDLST